MTMGGLAPFGKNRHALPHTVRAGCCLQREGGEVTTFIPSLPTTSLLVGVPPFVALAPAVHEHRSGSLECCKWSDHTQK